jgi:hypothetical protein
LDASEYKTLQGSRYCRSAWTLCLKCRRNSVELDLVAPEPRWVE